MAIPDIIPIMRIEDYHTHYLGKTKGGRQFWAYQTFVFSKPFSNIGTDDWKKYRREYVVLHTFDKTGKYLKTDHWFCGTTDTCDDKVSLQKLEGFISALDSSIEYGDIAVRPFSTIIDGYIFGLIPNEEYESVDLEPSSTISFHEPWDGEYDT